MTTYKELVYMVLDELKAKSDDFYYTEDHIIFLLEKYRAFLLKQKYRTPKSVVLNSNFMTIEFIADSGADFNIPGISILEITTPKIQNNPSCNYCSPERFSFVGNNKFLKSMKYFTIDQGVFKIKGQPGEVFMIPLKLKAVFESPTSVYKYLEKDPIDEIFPLEESLISPLLEMVVKDLTSAMFKPEDDINNGKDETGDLNKFMYQNSKSDLQKQIYG